MTVETSRLTGVAAGVPFLAVPPAGGPRADAPVVIGWHLMDPPRTEIAFEAALPMQGLDAWRVYLGLPLSGSRTPAGGLEEVMRLGYEDAVLNLHGPVITGAAAEFEEAFVKLQAELGFGAGPIGLFGGSTGAAVAALVMAEGNRQIGAAVLVSPLVQLRAGVDAIARSFEFSYPWSAASSALAERLDFVARAAELAEPGRPAVQLIVGADDDAEGFGAPAKLLAEDLAGRYEDPTRAQVTFVRGMAHALADEPGMDAAEQTPHAAQVDRLAVDWFSRHLVGAGG